MKTHNFLLAFILCLYGPTLVAQDYEPAGKGEIVKHTYYSLSYSEENEQAEWVYYLLTPEIVNGETKRSNNFRKDPGIKTGSASLQDYKGSGYDRGHMCPAGSMDMNKVAMSESFYMSNMSPQNPQLNRIGWKNLESQVRKWVNKYDSLYVVTGPIYRKSYDLRKFIGPNRVTVPCAYYKVIYCPKTNSMIAFICPNEKISKDLTLYIKTVDEVEKATGIDFFSQLPDDVENRLEEQKSFTKWYSKN